MTISSRTPEGVPHRCPVCGQETNVQPSYPGGDSCCARCGQLLWWFRDRLSRQLGQPIEEIALHSSLAGDLPADSLDIVELMMELEEEFAVKIPDADAEQLRTVADVLRYIERHRRQGR